jgi:hypothetical protein
MVTFAYWQHNRSFHNNDLRARYYSGHYGEVSFRRTVALPSVGFRSLTTSISGKRLAHRALYTALQCLCNCPRFCTPGSAAVRTLGPDFYSCTACGKWVYWSVVYNSKCVSLLVAFIYEMQGTCLQYCNKLPCIVNSIYLFIWLSLFQHLLSYASHSKIPLDTPVFPPFFLLCFLVKLSTCFYFDFSSQFFDPNYFHNLSFKNILTSSCLPKTRLKYSLLSLVLTSINVACHMSSVKYLSTTAEIMKII